MTVTMMDLGDRPAVAAVKAGGPSSDPGVLCPPQKFDYKIVKGFFVQNDPSIPRVAFEPTLLERNFGLVDTSPERWANLDRDVKRLQADAEDGVQYKVFFLGRHGQGWHNAAVDVIGVDPWEAYWTFQYGNDEFTWGPDPELTPEGIRQAREVCKVWKREKEFGAPVDKERMKWYVSPLTRTGQTMQESFQELLTGVPEVWEDWREIYGSHTCDLRSTRTQIAERFPTFMIEKGFAEEDPLWTADYRETDKEMQIRSRRAFDRVFSEGGAEELYVSITSHSAILRNVLAVLGHGPYPLQTGEMIPVVIKATPVKQEQKVNGRSGTNGTNGPADTNSNGVNGHAVNGQAGSNGHAYTNGVNGH